MSIKEYTKEHEIEITETLMSETVRQELLKHIESVIPDEDVVSYRDKGYSARLLLKSTGIDLVTKDGKLTKRILNALYKQFSVTPDNKWVGKLGNILKNLFTNNNKMSLTIVETNDFYQDPSYFVNESSCWWDSYTESRGLLFGTGGFGLVHRGGWSSLSRVWVVPYNDGYVYFNEYGDLTIPQWGKVICQIFFDGKDIPEATVDIHSVGNSSPYINSLGYYVGESKVDNDADIYIEWDTTYKWDYTAQSECDRCGDRVDSDDLYYSERTDRSYCEVCYDELFSSCDDCGDTTYIDDLNDAYDERGRNVSVCNGCFEDHYYECYHCGDFHHIDDTSSYSDDIYCTDCYNDHIKQCDECGDDVYDGEDGYIEEDGKVYCSPECLSESKSKEDEEN